MSRKSLIILSSSVLIYGILLATSSHRGFPKQLRNGISFPYLCDKPVGEDGYYILAVAWNLAKGEGIVYNYEQPTTGIQPLCTFLYGGGAWVTQQFRGDKWTLIQVILVFGVLNQILLAILVGKLTATLTINKEALAPMGHALGFVMTLFDMSLFRGSTYGLETGIYLTLFSICILYSLGFSDLPELRVRQSIVFGGLAGLTGLARIDFGLVLFVFLAMAIWRGQLRLRSVLIIGSTATLIVAPWMAYIYSITGGFMPSSGGAQGELVKASTALERAMAMAIAVVGNMTPWNFSPPNISIAVLGFAPILIFAFFSAKPRDLYLMVGSVLRNNPLLTNWIVSSVVLIVAYFIFFWDTHFYPRYTLPIVLTTIPLLAIVFAQGIRSLPRLTQTAALYAMPVCFASWAFVCFHLGRISSTGAITAGFVQSSFQGKRVGVFQSGVIGYFNPNVINLDGKIDNLALVGIKEKRLHAYLDRRGVQVLVDWPGYIYKNLDNHWLNENWRSCDVRPLPPLTICLERVGPERTSEESFQIDSPTNK